MKIIVADRRDCREDSKDCQVCIEANNVSKILINVCKIARSNEDCFYCS